jgi:predicted AlkP superfamily phosphohydrolase/phosphomutase
MHLLWQAFDKEHPAHNPEIVKKIENIFLKVFTAIDDWIAKFIQINPEADVLVFSGSGMGPNYSGWHLLPEVLKKLGMTSVSNGNGSEKSGFKKFLPSKKWGAYRIRKVEDTLSLNVIETLRRIIPRRIWDYSTRAILFAASDWKTSKAFSLPNDNSGAIRINLKGREPNGIVEPGEEYDELCNFLTNELLQLINIDSKTNAVEEVIRVDKIFKGDNLHDLPDLIVKWKVDKPVRGFQSPSVGTIYGENPERRSGGHRSISFFTGSGPDFSEGKILDHINLLDIPPTILHLLGVDVPQDYDGNVIHDMFKNKKPELLT